MQEIKLLALDMDGTTYYSMGEVVPANLEPIRQAIAQGVEVIFFTGRPPLAQPNRLKEHGFVGKNAIIVGHNGGAVYNLQQKKVIKSQPIPPKQAIEIFKLIKKPEFQGSVLWGYVDDLVTVVSNINMNDPQLSQNLHVLYPYQEEMAFFDGRYLEIKDYWNNFDFHFFKFLIFGARPGLFNAVRDLGFEVASSNGLDAEVTIKGVNKSTALEWLSRELKIPLQNTMAIGDGANDIEMIEHAGVGVAIKNSLPVIKEKADLYVDLTNTEGAVGFVIENYILKKEK
jgi:5-amino-6-(5-phospho-D-ribitylamino)uracil phosphatase